jgi:peptide-methionine (S)-S-oxide reductase
MKKELAVLAGGCFWGVEELLRQVPGVITTEVGYCGGDPTRTTYSEVKTGTTGHAEAIRIEFDGEILTYEKLLRLFFKLHDPTTLNRQGNDIGSQYRSAIFFQTPEQKVKAEGVISEISKSQLWKKQIVTQVIGDVPFFTAETFHQDYLQKNPGGYTCHYWRE